MGLLLLTGTGGAGTTTVAAATALRAARSGTKTLLLAPRPVLTAASGPAAALGLAAAPAGEPVEVEAGLALQQADAASVTAGAWSGLAAPLRGVLRALGADPLEAAEFTLPPGAADVVALLAVRDAVSAGWDLVVVDAGPLEAALALVALPGGVARLVERAVPVERRMLWAMGHGGLPLRGEGGSFVPGRAAVEALERLHAELAAAAAVLSGPDAAARLVVAPEPAAPDAARRARGGLALAGVAVDGVVVNRLVPAPAGPRDGWLTTRAAAQERVLADVARVVAPLPVAALAEHAEPVAGQAALAALAAGLDVLPGAPGAPPVAPAVERDGDGFVLVVALPGAYRDEVDLARRGDDLLLDVAGLRRALPLPSVLRRCEVTGAVFRDGALRVAFRPDPALWRPV